MRTTCFQQCLRSRAGVRPGTPSPTPLDPERARDPQRWPAALPQLRLPALVAPLGDVKGDWPRSMTPGSPLKLVPGGGVLQGLDTRDQGTCYNSPYSRRPRRRVKFLSGSPSAYFCLRRAASPDPAYAPGHAPGGCGSETCASSRGTKETPPGSFAATSGPALLHRHADAVPAGRARRVRGCTRPRLYGPRVIRCPNG